jgi:pilus assembly protein CpaF
MDNPQYDLNENGEFTQLKETLVNQILHDFNTNSIPPEEQNQVLVDLVIQKFKDKNIPILDDKRNTLFRQVIDEVLGFGLLQPYLDDPEVTEIMVNGSDHIFVTRRSQMTRLDKHFRSNEELVRLIFRNITRLGAVLDLDNPTLNTRLPDGSQLNIILPPIAVENPILSIHKPIICQTSLQNMIEQGTLSLNTAAFLEACVKARINILVIGLGKSGKTSLLNGLAGFIPDNERIVTIEETPQLALNQNQVLRLESQSRKVQGKPYSSPTDLIFLAGNFQPHRLIVDELRGSGGFAYLQALSTGCSGSIASLRANSSSEALSHLETMCLMSGNSYPHKVIQEQIASVLDLIIRISLNKDNSRRITTLTEISGMESENVILTDIYRFEQIGMSQDGHVIGGLKPTGIRPLFASRLEASGFTLNPEDFGLNPFESP